MTTLSSVLDLARMDPRSRIDRRLDRFLADHLPGQAPSGGRGQADSRPDDRLLIRPVVDLLLRGGKRLRPVLCYWAWRGAGGADCDAAVAAATALELLQGCALIHDDVMDGSDLRRGGPTIHRALADTHAARGWRGDPDRFGIAAAVAAGDLCLIWADEMLRGCGLPAASLTRAGPVYDALRAEAVRGQCLDLFFQAEGALRVEDALRAAESKTAASTTVGPLRFGGALAGADEGLMSAYVAYGRPLGVAFQLRDDLLGAFGDPGDTGKPSGDDLRDGKCTVLLAEARRRTGARGRALIDALLHAESDAAVDEVREVIEAGGARAHVTRMIAALGREAVQAIDTAPLTGGTDDTDDTVRDVLRALAIAVTGIVDPDHEAADAASDTSAVQMRQYDRAGEQRYRP